MSDDYEIAIKIALRYIDHAPRTTTEMQKRLARAQIAPDVIEAVISALQDLDLLDDSRFGREWVETRSRSKRYGSKRLAAELRAKGLPAELITRSLQHLHPEDEFHTALELAQQRLGNHPQPDSSTLRRLAAYLHRRGYNFDIIQQVFAQLVTNDIVGS